MKLVLSIFEYSYKVGSAPNEGQNKGIISGLQLSPKGSWTIPCSQCLWLWYHESDRWAPCSFPRNRHSWNQGEATVFARSQDLHQGSMPPRRRVAHLWTGSKERGSLWPTVGMSVSSRGYLCVNECIVMAGLVSVYSLNAQSQASCSPFKSRLVHRSMVCGVPLKTMMWSRRKTGLLFTEETVHIYLRRGTCFQWRLARQLILVCVLVERALQIDESCFLSVYVVFMCI